MLELLRKLKIDETYTKPIKNIKYDKVVENTYPKAEYNVMADVLFLPKKIQIFLFISNDRFMESQI